MIGVRRKDGVEVNVETSNDPAEVERFLTRVLQPETYALLKKQLVDGEEIFFEFTGANNEELPRLRHYLVHLDIRSRGAVNPSMGDFYVVFHVHKDHLAAAQEMAKHLKSKFKNANDWEETSEHAVATDKFFQIPPLDIK